MTAPTEAEIRELVATRLAHCIAEDEISIGDWLGELIEPIRYANPNLGGMANRVWADLRPTEEARLAELVEGIYTAGDVLTQELAKKIGDLIVAAAMTFATEHPDAPRAVREAVTA